MLVKVIVISLVLLNPFYAAEISYVYAGSERIARTIDHALLQSYVADNKDSVLNVVDGVAPVTGVTYQYDAYGVVLKSPTISIPNPFQYNGEWTDQFSQLQYLRARFYHPKLMRFVQQDSFDLANRFNYGDGNPIVNSDPSGHFELSSFAFSWNLLRFSKSSTLVR
jgi:RHS repeat-associated protein